VRLNGVVTGGATPDEAVAGAPVATATPPAALVVRTTRTDSRNIGTIIAAKIFFMRFAWLLG
jgi:hypothetical protein